MPAGAGSSARSSASPKASSPVKSWLDFYTFFRVNVASCFVTFVSDVAARQSPLEAVRRSIRKLEEKRYAVMKQRNIIGQVCHTPKSYDNVMHVGLRKVTFKWQRGNKIGITEYNTVPKLLYCSMKLHGSDHKVLGYFGTGEGQYGKVYTCINVDTGELMAMKEVCELPFLVDLKQKKSPNFLFAIN